jgi:AAA15 family ATPase/GTPase
VNFSVTNFRSITSAHKISISDTTVLIGRNNEGKSNLLKALKVSMELLQFHAFSERGNFKAGRLDSEAYNWKRDFPIQLQERKGVSQTIFKLEFLLDDEEIAQFKKEMGSSLNGSLPLELRVGSDNRTDIKLRKPGKNTRSLSDKSGKIADFVGRRIHFNYIPAIRTDAEALEVISRMLSSELRVLESEQEYQDALAVITKLQEPILENLAARLQVPLAEFLPSIKNVKIEIPETSRRVGLRRDFSVIIDDGTPTNIAYKGDGVKSLAALGLLKNMHRRVGASIIAIEEPESHLHPGAIHQLVEIIKSLAEENQVIITTHNPLFVDRSNIKSNIVVNDGKASAAKSVAAIRDLLGIKASDNLTHANFALVVEGEEDVVALKALLPILSEKVGRALKNNSLIIEPIGGAGNLSYKLSLLRTSLCYTHSLLDNDESGRLAFDKAQKDSLVSIQNCTFVTCLGMNNSEFEDCILPDVYKDAVLEAFGVELKGKGFRGSNKWSDRMKATFMEQGKPWSDTVSKKVKSVVAGAIEKKPDEALSPHKRNSIDALVDSLERMIKV